MAVGNNDVQELKEEAGKDSSDSSSSEDESDALRGRFDAFARPEPKKLAGILVKAREYAEGHRAFGMSR